MATMAHDDAVSGRVDEAPGRSPVDAAGQIAELFSSLDYIASTPSFLEASSPSSSSTTTQTSYTETAPSTAHTSPARQPESPEYQSQHQHDNLDYWQR